MKTFKPIHEVYESELSPAVKDVVLRCMQSLIDAYGPDFDADDTG